MTLCRFLFLTALALAPAAWAQAPAGGDGGQRRLIEQKRDLADNMLYQSAGAKRIAASSDQAAQQQLAEARGLFDRARAALDANDLKTADSLLSEALRKMSKAARQVPDAAAEEDEKRQRFNKTLAEIEGFQSAYESSMQRLGSESTAAALKQVSESVTKAKSLADKGKWDEANQVLSDAHGVMVNSMNKLLASKTITYELKFDSPKAEFEYELKRNQSYEELVPMALANFRPPEDVVKQVEEFVGKGQELRAAAKKQAVAGDYQSALDTLSESTGYMQTAVEQAGAVMQQ